MPKHITVNDSLADLTTRNHADLQNKNAETDYKHLTDAQKTALDSGDFFDKTSDTTDDITESSSKFFLTSDENNALSGAPNALSASNPVADKTYVDSIATGIGSRLLVAVSDITALKALDTTNATNYPDKSLINVESKGLYRLDRDSSETGDDDRIVAPTAGVGRWYKMSASINDHNSLNNIQGGTTNEYYHFTSAQASGLTGSGETALHTHDHGALNGKGDDDHPQYALLAGRNGDTLKIDTINEYTSDAGVTIDGLLIKDGQVDGVDLSAHAGGTAKSQHTGGLGDHTHQSSGAEGGKIDHGLALNGLGDDDHTQYALLAGRVSGQTITGGTGAGEDLTLRSTSNASKGNVIIEDIALVDQIIENTLNAGVTIEGVLLKDSQVNVDTINEKTGDTGVTIDSVLIKDGQVDGVDVSAHAADSTIHFTEGSIDHGNLNASSLTDDDHTQYALLNGRNGNVLKIDTISEYTSDNGVAVDGVTMKDNGVVCSSDMEVTDSTKGLILSDGTNRWRVTVDNTGNLVTSQL